MAESAPLFPEQPSSRFPSYLSGCSFSASFACFLPSILNVRVPLDPVLAQFILSTFSLGLPSTHATEHADGSKYVQDQLTHNPRLMYPAACGQFPLNV